MTKTLIKNLFIALFLELGISFSSFAQNNYPVAVTPVLTPPYTLNLSDYCSLGSQKLTVYLYGNDLNISQLPVKLQIKIESLGITIENAPTLPTTPIYIDGGATTLLYGSDLTDYFKIDNLTFKGFSKEAYR